MPDSLRYSLTLSIISLLIFSLELQASSKTSIAVEINIVEVENYSEPLKSVGSLAAKNQVMLTSQVKGIIDHLNIADGIQVKSGQSLITLDCRFAQARLNEVKARFNEDNRRLKELQNLVDKKAASRSELDNQQSLVAQSLAACRATETTLDYYVIRAPFSGTLGMSQLSKGQYIKPGDPLVRLVNLDNLYVEFNLPSRYLSQIQTGQALSLSVEAWPGKMFKAHISGVDLTVNKDSRNLTIRGNIKNTKYLLCPGLLAEITLSLPSIDRLSVKTSSIFYKGNQAYVYRVNDDNSVTLTAVSIATTYRDKAFILSGLLANEKVVARGVVKLSDGAIITPISTTTDQPISERKS